MMHAFTADHGAPVAQGGMRQYYVRNRAIVHAGVLLALFLVVVSWQWIVVAVPTGHVGVKWYRFLGGTDTANVHGEGSHLVLPWDQMTIYDARTQQLGRDFEVLTKDGLSMTMNIAVQYRLNQRLTGMLHKAVGPHYVETLLVPAVGSYFLHAMSRYATDEAYTLRRAQIQDEVRRDIAAELTPRPGQPDRPVAPWLLVEGVLIRGMRFPTEVQAAVNRKMEQYQLREEYTYRLERETLESRRKQVEAEGIARFQQIVGAGISDNYLKWKGIDATLALAQSTNAKVVVIGTPKDGMPLILGGESAPRLVEGAQPKLPEAAVPRAGLLQTEVKPLPEGSTLEVAGARH